MLHFNTMKRYILFSILLALNLKSGWLFSDSKPRGNIPIKISVSIPPEAGIVNAVGGKNIDVSILVGKGQDPHTFQPSPKQIMELSKSKLYFKIGLPFETQIVRKLKNIHTKMKIVNIASGVKLRELTHHNHGHSDKEHHHCTEHHDPHIWLSPVNLKIMAKNVCRQLSEIDKKNKNVYKQNLKRYIASVNKTDQKIATLLAPYKGGCFYVFHPAFGYFGEHYGLKEKAVEISGKSPSPKQVYSLIKAARKDNVKIIFMQPQFDQKSGQTIAKSIGGIVVSLDPLTENVLKNLEDTAEKIEQSFKLTKQPGN